MTEIQRRPFIAGNWKLNKTQAEAFAFCEALKHKAGEFDYCDLLVAPTFTSLAIAREALKKSAVALAAQNCYAKDDGAYTGEVSAALLLDAGCSHVIVGHSERRQLFFERDEDVRTKFWAARRHRLVPILCVGETLQEREAGDASKVVLRQLAAVLSECPESLEVNDVVIAYEPVWAIGTGKTASPEDAEQMHAEIRTALEKHLGKTLCFGIRVLYGGSVKPDNATQLLSKPNIDGALIGGASLDLDSFLAIARASAPCS
ncbi:MAG: triose-phosphate isomerase [Myxococcales bacterium]|nr:MAG: triose-phosphate isomerase [Myxococcales bacterium]